MENIRLIIDNNYEVVEVVISKEDEAYLQKLHDNFKNAIELRKINSDMKDKAYYVKLMQEDSVFLLELACRIKIADKMPTKEEILRANDKDKDSAFMSDVRRSMNA